MFMKENFKFEPLKEPVDVKYDPTPVTNVIINYDVGDKILRWVKEHKANK